MDGKGSPPKLALDRLSKAAAETRLEKSICPGSFQTWTYLFLRKKP
jgi:hypothetical protein